MFVLKEQYPTTNLSIQCNDQLIQVTFSKGKKSSIFTRVTFLDSKPLFNVVSLTLDDYKRLCAALRVFPFEEVTSNNECNIQEVPTILPQKAETERMVCFHKK